MSSAGSLLVVGFEGPRLRREERRILERAQPGGIVLFGRNLEDENSLRELVREVRALVPEVLLCLDAEGGRVDRLRRIVGPAPAAEDLARRPPSAARRAGRWVGAALRVLGFDLDFAPVVDLDHQRGANALERRCFGASPRSVVARAGAFLSGLAEAGVAGCVKHFPGLGRAGEDTHLAGAAIRANRHELEKDLAPFAALLPRADTAMVAHASYPAWDPEERPGTLSRPIATGLLKERLGFAQLAFTDDLEMEALAPWGGLVERATAALTAGCDGLLVCRRLDEVPAIVERLEAPALRPRRDEAMARWHALRRRIAARRNPVGDRLPSIAEVSKRLALLAEPAAQNGMSSSAGVK